MPTAGEDDYLEEGVDKDLEWTDLIDKKSVTAVLWAVRAFARSALNSCLPASCLPSRVPSHASIDY